MRVSKLLKRKVNNNHPINDLKNDSRKVNSNDVFYAIKGSLSNGNEYILMAINNGAKTIVSEENCDLSNQYPNINFILVEDVRKTLALHAKIFYQNISSSMILIGITGTNGKTTVSTLIYKYFQYLNKKATLIGTNGIYIMNRFFSTNNTTPDILEIYQILLESKKNGVNHVIMEVSSHAIKMLRIFGIDFKIALITNLTQDHLDFHKTMEDYRYTKGIFLSRIAEENTVIINKDMEDYQLFNHLTKANVLTYGQSNSNFQFINPIFSIEETKFDLKIANKIYPIKTSLLGLFNVYNLTSFIAIIYQLRLFNNQTIEFINSKINILGRMEVLKISNRYCVIDFAHTPDGVLNVLNFLNYVKINKLILVIGCGGERDPGKRKIIGDIAVRLANYVIFTNDNPRGEEPDMIIKDILEGVKTNNYQVILDRKMAIEEAFKLSLNNDIIAILGKGNEQYQIFKDEKIPFNDKIIVQGIKL